MSIFVSRVLGIEAEVCGYVPEKDALIELTVNTPPELLI
jgi:hypothetical protein